MSSASLSQTPSQEHQLHLDKSGKVYEISSLRCPHGQAQGLHDAWELAKAHREESCVDTP